MLAPARPLPGTPEVQDPAKLRDGMSIEANCWADERARGDTRAGLAWTSWAGRNRDNDGADHETVMKLTCQEVLDQLWEYLDEDARAELKSQINTHLNGCGHCKVEVDSLRQTISLYRCEEQAPIPIQLSGKLRAALHAAYSEPPADKA